MSNNESKERAEFRKYCREWLAKNIPPAPAFRLPHGPLEISNREQLDFLVAWQRSAYKAGLVGCDYPKEYGGYGMKDCQRIANEEMTASGAWFLPNIVGLGMAGPTILTHGTEEQKRALLPGILSSDEIWCQGFSEPGAGSDLANVSTTAVRDGDRWIVNGSKIWTTLAAYAGWVILVCRTDSKDKYKGLTYFACPMDQPDAVEVRPLIKMTGEYGFFEVHFENLIVEDKWRLDEVGAGWKVCMSTLLHERGSGGIVPPKAEGGLSSVGMRADELVPLAKEHKRGGRPALSDPLVRDQIVDLLIQQRAFDNTHRRAAVPALNDHPMRLAMQHKVVESELRQNIGRVGCSVLGMPGLLGVGDPQAPHSGEWPVSFMGSYGYTIAAGTNEIQRNILGERVLGLEKSK